MIFLVACAVVAYAKLGSRIVYDPDELEAFFAARSITTRDTEIDRARGGK
jgi:hypothetical protein